MNNKKIATAILAGIFVILFALVGVGSCGGIKYLIDERTPKSLTVSAEEANYTVYSFKFQLPGYAYSIPDIEDISESYTFKTIPFGFIDIGLSYSEASDSIVSVSSTTQIFTRANTGMYNTYSTGINFTDGVSIGTFNAPLLSYRNVTNDNYNYDGYLADLYQDDTFIALTYDFYCHYSTPSSGNNKPALVYLGAYPDQNIMSASTGWGLFVYNSTDELIFTISITKLTETIGGIEFNYSYYNKPFGRQLIANYSSVPGLDLEKIKQDNYDLGYNFGYDDAIRNNKDIWYNDGFNAGVIQGASNANDYSFLGLIGAVIDVPVQAFIGLTDFELFGFNMTSFYKALFAFCAIVIVIRLVLP